MLGNNPASIAISAGGANLYQHQTNGALQKFIGTVRSGGSSPGRLPLDNRPMTTAIDSAGSSLFQLHGN